MQIRRVLRERSEQFDIKNPEKTIILLQQLSDGDTGINISAVVENLINRKEYKKAKKTQENDSITTSK